MRIQLLQLNKKRIIILSSAVLMLVFAIILTVCIYHKVRENDFESMTIFDYLNRSDDQLSITMAALILSKEYNPSIKFETYIKFVDGIADKVRYYVGVRTDPDYRIAAINTAIYRDYKFSYDKSDYMGTKAINHFLSSVIDRRQGVCSTLPLVYLVVAERLNYPIYAVNAPAHTFCRYVTKDMYKQDGYINIEATSGGSPMPDVEFIDEFKISKQAYQSGVYLRTLTKREYVGYLLCEAGVYHGQKGEIKNSLRYFEESVHYNPRLSEAYHFIATTYMLMAKHSGDINEINDFLLLSEINELKAQALGRDNPAPPDYWQKSSPETQVITRNVNGIEETVPADFEAKIKTLNNKYRDYFNQDKTN
jgi:regulator of sirC expression with transglutaminase-like and TPR domain